MDLFGPTYSVVRDCLSFTVRQLGPQFSYGLRRSTFGPYGWV